MNIIPICDYLRPLLSPTYLEVRPSRSLEAEIQDRDAELPLLLLHPWQEEAGPNRYDTIVSQTVAEQFAVITICPIADLGTNRDKLFSVLLGSVLPDHTHEVIFKGGTTMNIDASVIWWRDIFTTHLERRQSS